MKQKVLVWLLSVCMVLTMMPLPAFATGTDTGVAKIGETSYATLQSAIDAATDGVTITLQSDVTENVIVPQQENVKITIDGYDNAIKGALTVDGKSAAYESAALTIKNVHFDASAIDTDACINLGVEGDNNTRYTNHVTVEKCTFTGGGRAKAAIKSYTGGDKNLTVTGCTVDNTMHSLLQAESNITGILIDGCTVNSKNGINLNSSSDVEIKNSNIAVSGYAVRIGVNDGTSGKVTLENNTLKTDNTEGDAVVVLRGTATTLVDLTMAENVVSGAIHISGTAEDTTISADANYWDGKDAPVVSGAEVEVNTYYSDAAKLTLAQNGLVGEGTTEDPILIGTVKDLKAFRKAVNEGDDFAGKVVKLTANIDLAGENWIPIGDNTNYFRGTFDGGDHTISNMTIDVNTPGEDKFLGLFGGVKNAVIKNLTMKDTNINAVGKKVRAAAVVGIASSDTTTPAVLALNFENIKVDGCTINAEANSGSALIGGVVGYSYPANMKGITVSDLTIDAKAEGNEVRAAAINGYVCGQNISNNGNTRMAFDVKNFDVDNVEITAKAYTVFAGGYAPYTYYGYITLENGTIDGLKMDIDAHEAFVGGLVGYFWRSDNGHNVKNVNITGIDFDVTTDYLGETRIGGMVGTSQSPNTKYTDCSVSGKIVERCSDSENPVNYHAKVGGFVARTYEYAQQTYTNCVADVDVTGSNIAGGFVGNHNSTVSYVNCEAKGDVTANTAGGFAGRVTEHGYTTDVTFDGCKASGNVDGTNVAGGFIGSTANHGWAAWAAGNGTAYGKNITLKDCEITGEVKSGTDYKAGVIGEAKVADGKTITMDNVSYVVEPAYYPEGASVEIPVYVAQIGDKKFKTLKDAVDYANSLKDADNNPIPATIELGEDVKISEMISVSGNITIKGDAVEEDNNTGSLFNLFADEPDVADTITWADDYTGTLFNVAEGGSLAFEDVIIDGENEFTFYNDTTTVEDGQNWYTRFVNVGEEDKAVNANVFVNAGNLTLGEGTKIQNVTIASDGDNGKTANTETGGFYLMYNDDLALIQSNGGTVNMNGAEIAGNAGLALNAVNTVSSIKDTKIQGNMGAGNKGGIIIANDGTMVIEGESSISNNKAMARSATILGVINGAEVELNSNAKIENNKHIGVGSNTAGAIVVLEGASQFVMNGGSISNNEGGRAGAIASRWVGGSHGQHEETSIVLNAGTIAGNTATNDSWNGASVFLRSPATIGEGMTIDGGIAVNAAPGELEITGGTFDGELIVADGLTAEITGGTFGYDVSEFVPFGYTQNEDGTIKSGYVINNKAQLLEFVAQANKGNTFSGKTIKLNADIDLDGMTWTPINSFAGTFDGQEHTISNFKLVSADNTRTGFFRNLGQYPATVKNLKLDNIEGTAGNNKYFGILVGNGHTSILDNIHISNVKVTTAHKDAWVGGFYGYFNWTTATNCTITNLEIDATAGAMFIGGFSGNMDQDLTCDNVDIDGFKVTVVDTDNDCAVGGFTGQTQTGWRSPYFVNCDVTGIDITASGTVDVGGFVADPGAHTKATNCTTEGKVDATGVTSVNCNIGGFFADAGWNDNLGTHGGHKLVNCTANVDITTNIAPAGGFIGSAMNDNNRNMPIAFTNCSAEGDITCTKGGTASIGGFAGDADRGTYDECTASGTITNNGTGYAGQFIGALNAAANVDIATKIEDCTYTGKSTYLEFIGNAEEDVKLDEVVVVNAAKIGVKRYKTLEEAIAAAQDGDTIKLLIDNDENVTIHQLADQSFTIDGNGKTYTGTIIINGSKRSAGKETLTIKDMNFVADTSEQKFIIAASGTYAHNVTIEDCTFDGGEYGDAYGMQLQNAYNIVMKSIEANNLFELVYANKAVTGFTAENVEATGVGYGFWMPYAINANFKKIDIEATYAGVGIRNNNKSAATFEDCVITAEIPVLLSGIAGGTREYTLTFKDANDFDATEGGALVKVSGTDAVFKVVLDGTNLKANEIEGVVAAIDNTYYNTLQYAIDAAADGDTIKVVKDINIADVDLGTLDSKYNTLFKVEGKSVTIDLNGKTISGEYTGDSMLVGVFSTDNAGHLILTGNGTMDVTATATVYALLVNYEEDCSITVENGTYKLDKASDSLIYTGGNEDVIVNDGSFTLSNVGTGTNESPWIFNAGGQNTAHVIVNGGTFNADIAHQYYPFEVQLDKEKALKNNGDNTWTVVDAVAYVGEQEYSGGWYTNEIGYATLEEAIMAADAGETVTMLTDVELSAPITVAADDEIVLDLNGKTISYTTDVAGEAMITNNGELTITDSTEKAAGEINFAYVGTPDSAYSKGNYTIANAGTLVVENGVVKNSTAKMSHAYYTIQNGGNGSFTLDGGKIINETNYAIRQFASGSNTNTVTINDGEVSGTRAVWMQAAGSKAENAPNIILDVNGGKLVGTGETGFKLAVYSYSYGDSLANVNVDISNGEIVGDIALTGGKNKTVAETVTITNGTFDGAVYSYAEDSVAGETINISGGTFTQEVEDVYCAEGYVPCELENGLYGVEKGAYVAEFNGEKYATLQDALDAAAATESTEAKTVTLIANVTETSYATVVPAGVTLDLNGCDLTAKNILAFGAVIDTADEVGGIVISNDTTKAFVQLQQDNAGYLPIYDTTTGSYKFFKYELVSRGTKTTADGKAKFGFAITFVNNEAYDVLASTTESNMDLVIDITWKDINTPIRYTLTTVQEYAKAVVNNNYDASKKAMTVTISGLANLEAGDYIYTKLNVETVGGVNAALDATAYEVQ